jgi:hypothetical protein
MMKQIGVVALVSSLVCLANTNAGAQSNYPIIDRIAQRVVQKYETSSCAQLAAQRAQRAAGGQNPMEQRAVAMLRQNPQMRQEFLNRVAAPIANRLFECGMIP